MVTEVEWYESRVDEAMDRAGSGVDGAIYARCVDCQYDPSAKGSPTAQISNCQATDCPLFPYRPNADNRPAELMEISVKPVWGKTSQWQRRSALIRKKQELGTRRGAIDAYCIDCTVDLGREEPGTWAQQVAGCLQTQCPLYRHRAKSEANPRGDTDGYKSKFLEQKDERTK